ncbi:L-glutamate gamma-semialdehyde dehydrogenase [Bailinhaonella thermotolerans]|uniref:L-glutamate gamma-semialdehyde dehydrogenase n=1 Tax=Bailinhaonella thermotolerans TaxID=1070861 RepID=A0A3A4AT08_9ACTN|nr:L-glutamate gamma-semialdehyde dehydrogenase [Bailinhaonella thermotolerans]RJL30434.1 L-glutamate gamma-semialdehyde dehydrogenase [Bailinhaonella thermotolerans]
MDAVTNVPVPKNEPVKNYAPGSPERAALEARIKELGQEQPALNQYIGGVWRESGGEPFDVVSPHNFRHVLGQGRNAAPSDVRAAISAALEAAPAWHAMSFDDRAAIFLRAAELLAGPWRQTLNAATMLGQSKSVYQAEIDSACELIDFLRYNVAYARKLYEEQPDSSPGVWNRMEFRPLEGFVVAITPFNFTAIAANLPCAPALMGNVVVWKPSPTQQFAAHYTMRLLEEAGLPPGVINMVTGDGVAVSEEALPDPALAGIHFTGSTATFQMLWKAVGENIGRYQSYPRLVGETGGKDFIVAHPSADPSVLATAMIRGAFEYQGQKCSAASRAYVPRSLWEGMRDDFCEEVESIPMGDVTADLSMFMGAVIDERAFGRHREVLERARAVESIRVLTGGGCDGSVGWFIEPTVLEVADPYDELFAKEYFGPIMAVHVYEDAAYDDMLRQMESHAPFALTGSIIARDRQAIAEAAGVLRFAAGNLYINDKPTGAVVGQQPFGGARASGTNDKAGSIFNLIRWTNVRTIKETFAAPTDYRYPHMG